MGRHVSSRYSNASPSVLVIYIPVKGARNDTDCTAKYSYSCAYDVVGLKCVNTLQL